MIAGLQPQVSWFRRSWEGSEILHFSQAPWGCSWFMDHPWSNTQLGSEVPFPSSTPGLFQNHSIRWSHQIQLSFRYAHNCTWRVFIVIFLWMTTLLQRYFSHSLYLWVDPLLVFIRGWPSLTICLNTEQEPPWPSSLGYLLTLRTLFSCHSKKMSVYLHWSI